MNDDNEQCCFKACCYPGRSPIRSPIMSLEVFSAADDPNYLHTHEQCFIERQHPDVTFDNPKDHGQIPSRAKCIFCGDSLPRIGKHPYCFNAGSYKPPHRYWAHAGCMKAMLTSTSMAKLLR